MRLVSVLSIGLVIIGFATAKKADGSKTSLPSIGSDIITPSRGIGPFDAKQAQEWRDTAETLCAQSRYEEAEKLYVKLLEEREHALGLNNPEPDTDLNDLGRVNFAQMKDQQATSYYERSLQIMETAKCKQDLLVVDKLYNVLRIDKTLEKYPQAEQYALRALATVEKAKGPDSIE